MDHLGKRRSTGGCRMGQDNPPSAVANATAHAASRGSDPPLPSSCWQGEANKSASPFGSLRVCHPRAGSASVL
jgi:hypothetical protein